MFLIVRLRAEGPPTLTGFVAIGCLSLAPVVAFAAVGWTLAGGGTPEGDWPLGSMWRRPWTPVPLSGRGRQGILYLDGDNAVWPVAGRFPRIRLNGNGKPVPLFKLFSQTQAMRRLVRLVRLAKTKKCPASGELPGPDLRARIIPLCFGDEEPRQFAMLFKSIFSDD